MSVSVWIRLSFMMMLQYWVWGAWYSYLPIYMDDTLNFNAFQGGVMMSMLYFASMIAPFIGGQIADRYMASERFLAISQLLGGVMMLLLAGQTEYWPFLILMFLWSMFYAPTIPLTNVICFQNLKNVEREFGWIRIWGTIGWILSGFALTYWLRLDPDGSNCMRLAGYAAIVYGLFSFCLPHTPPKKEAEKPFAFLEALKLLKDPTFLIFMIISFVVATELQFYYYLTGPFLVDLGMTPEDIPAWMTLAQIAEIFSLIVLLPLVLPRAGVKLSIAIGIIAWPVRYVIFAMGGPLWLIIASLPLHGLCYVFFFIVGQIYVDKASPKGIRNSAQALLTFVTFGLGMTLGGVFAGWIRSIFTMAAVDGGDPIVNWTYVFIVPIVLTVLCAIVFLAVFREPVPKDEPEAAQA